MKTKGFTRDGEIGTRGLIFYCPGCKRTHAVNTLPNMQAPKEPVWHWNGDRDRPTLDSSVHITVFDPEADDGKGGKGKRSTVCHLLLRDGLLQFLSDCAHDLKGQTVQLPDLPRES